MAAESPLTPELLAKFGPLRSYPSGDRVSTMVDPDKLVQTHCCFCGQQCGIQLKVKDNAVVGFEPRDDFPTNHGMLCPKGVRRYLQGSHHDRLTQAYFRDPSSATGFRAVAYEEAIQRTASEIQRIQSTYGNNAFAVFGGASMTTEKCYLMGKFARMCLKTRYTDYNGRLCMVSAGVANKKAFGVDRAANAMADIPLAEVVWISGANVAECAPITTSYVWQARDNGARIINVDPRLTPLARGCDLVLPVKPGRDAALFAGILHLMIEHDWLDHDFIRQYTVDFDKAAAVAKQWNPKRTAEVTGIRQAAIEQAAEWWGTAKTSYLMHARGLEQHIHGVHNCLGSINIVLASGRIGRPGCGYGTITGQGNGQGGREHGQKTDQLPGGRDVDNPQHRQFIANFWGIPEPELPHSGVDCYEILRKVETGEIRGLLSWSINPAVSLPDSQYVKRMLSKLEFYVNIDFFLSESGRFADVVLPGSQHEEDEGVVCSTEGRVIKINQAVDPPGDAKQDWRIMQDIARALGRERGFTFNNPREIFDEMCRASAGGVIDYSGITYEKIEAQNGVFWPCPATDPDGRSIDHPGTPRLFEPGSWNSVARGAGPFYFPDGKARFHGIDYAPPTEDVDETYPLMLTTGRTVNMFLSGNQTRRIGPLVDQYPEPLLELHPTLAEKHGIRDRDWVTVESRRGAMTVRCQVVATIRPDVVFVPYHWGGEKSINLVTISAQDPYSKIPEFKVCAVRIRKSEAPEYASWLEPQQ
ncbi:MAG: molybdopterin oxidoreductase family protein [Bacteroidales bacterium]|nr:molybdopterin oxidoreductase family protein [Bacteroidales bacterium]